MALAPHLNGNMPNSSKKRKAAELEQGQSPRASKLVKRRAKSKRPTTAPVDEIPFETQSPLQDDYSDGDAFVGTENLAEGFTFRYAVKPGAAWKEMRSYKNVKYAESTFSIGDVVYINRKQIPPKAPADSASDAEVLAYDRKNFWVAMIADTRAISSNAVYLRVYWLYWPEELPMGRQPYHTDNELVLSNAMDIIDAQTISSMADVRHWDDNEVEAEIPDRFWRQTLDISRIGTNKTSGLSLLKAHCTCQRPYNPEETMYQCKEPQCATWNHGACLIDDATERAQTLYKTSRLDQADVSKIKQEEHKDSLRFLSPLRDLGKFMQNKVLPVMSSTPEPTTVPEVNGVTGAKESSPSQPNGQSLSKNSPTKPKSPSKKVHRRSSSSSGKFQITLVDSENESNPLLARVEKLSSSVNKKKKAEATGKVWFIHVNCLKCGKAMD